jgi:hypothetical protein
MKTKKHYNYIMQLRRLCQAVTELDKQQIENARPAGAADQAQPNILDIAARNTEASRAALLHYTELSVALLQRLEKILEEMERKK